MAAVPAIKDNAYDVSDPTDWQGTPLASLTQVEHSLRCHVCKDFFNSPMTTSCCHTFCSLCIRRALNTDGKCPLCRAVDQESRLRGNPAIREVVDAFTTSRDSMLQFARQPPAGISATTPKRKADEEADEGSAPKRTRMSTRSSSAKATRVTAAIMEEEADVPETKEEEAFIPDDGLVECPICQWRMEPQKVDRHLDTDCPGEPRPRPVQPKHKKFGFPTARNSINTPVYTHDRLPALNYALLNETKLRKKLSDVGIPAMGTRLAMEKRYKEWAMMWNANCDSTRPKTKHELLRDLDVWERTQGSLAPTSSVAANLGAQIKDKNFDGAGWSTKHSDSFKDLIANARKSQQKRAEDETKPEKTQPVEAPAAPIPGETAGNIELDTDDPSDMSLPLLPAQLETIPVERADVVDLTSPARGHLNGGGIPPG